MMNQDNLRQKTLRALSWSLIDSIGPRVVRFVLGIVLARVLFPEQFGLVGMIMIFVAVAQALIDSGFGAALIQKSEATSIDIDSVFYFNIAAGIAIAGVLCLIAPWIASFYNQPALTSLTRAFSLTIVINSFGLIPTTLLTKYINFKALSRVSLISSLCSGVIGLLMAFKGFGVWSLVAQQVSASLFTNVLVWFWSSWRPQTQFSITSLRSMFGYGSRMLASGLLQSIFENIYMVVIGKLFSPADLGFFTRANTFQEVPSHTISWVVSRVTFPVFASIQHDKDRLKRGMKQILTGVVMVTCPMMIGLAVIARPLILVLLGERWAESIPYLHLLSFLGMLFPLALINLNLLEALGHSRLSLHLNVLKRVLIVVNIALMWKWGISAMICGMIVSSAISYYLNGYYAGVRIGYPIQEQLKDLAPYFMTASLMGAAVYLVGLLSLPSDLCMLLLQVVVGFVTYVLLCLVFRLNGFNEVWQAGIARIVVVKSH